MSEQDFLNTIYPGIKNKPECALTQDEFIATCEMFTYKKPSEHLIKKAVEMGVIKK